MLLAPITDTFRPYSGWQCPFGNVTSSNPHSFNVQICVVSQTNCCNESQRTSVVLFASLHRCQTWSVHQGCSASASGVVSLIHYFVIPWHFFVNRCPDTICKVAIKHVSQPNFSFAMTWYTISMKWICKTYIYLVKCFNIRNLSTKVRASFCRTSKSTYGNFGFSIQKLSPCSLVGANPVHENKCFHLSNSIPQDNSFKRNYRQIIRKLSRPRNVESRSG